MKKMINLTPHKVTLLVSSRESIVLESKGQARLTTDTIVVGNINGVSVTETVFGEVEGLPHPEQNTIYIVSRLIVESCKERRDLYFPNELIRDDKGIILGCKSISR